VRVRTSSDEWLEVVRPGAIEIALRLGDGIGKIREAGQWRLHEPLRVLPAEHVGRALHGPIDEDKTGSESWPGAHQLEGDSRTPGVPDHHRALEPELLDDEHSVVDELLHGVAGRRIWRLGRPAAEAVPALVEGDEMPASELPRQAVPVAGVGAQSVQKKHRRIGPRFTFRAPLDVVKIKTASIEPSVGRFSHRTLA